MCYFQLDQNKCSGLRLLSRHIHYSSPAENQNDEKSESDCKPLFINLFMKLNWRGMKKTSLLCILIFTKLSKKGLQIWWYSAAKWQRISSHCSFHPFLIGLTPWSQSQTAYPWVSLCFCLFILKFPCNSHSMLSLAPTNREHVFVDVHEKKWLKRIRAQHWNSMESKDQTDDS